MFTLIKFCPRSTLISLLYAALHLLLLFMFTSAHHCFTSDSLSSLPSLTEQGKAVSFHQNSKAGPEWITWKGRKSKVFHEAQALLHKQPGPDGGEGLRHWWELLTAPSCFLLLLLLLNHAVGLVPCPHTALWCRVLCYISTGTGLKEIKVLDHFGEVAVLVIVWSVQSVIIFKGKRASNHYLVTWRHHNVMVKTSESDLFFPALKIVTLFLSHWLFVKDNGFSQSFAACERVLAL